eukprot:c24168_g1_i1 orf=126-1358(+)
MEISCSPLVSSRYLHAPSILARSGTGKLEWGASSAASRIAHLLPLLADCSGQHKNRFPAVLIAVSRFEWRDSIRNPHGGSRCLGHAREDARPCNSGADNSREECGECGVDSREEKEEDDIALKLPDLQDVLKLLRDKWKGQSAGGRERKGPGEVFLVGTGPGDPELLTLKALRLMQTADLVLYDRLVSPDILDMVHTGARLLYVGKAAGYHSRTQDEIHELLLNFAEAGATVVRLKGGDPLLFGRGGEEIDFLQQQGIKVKVVPGITAASGIAAELGIPLTLRDAASSVRFLTGHSRKGGTDPLYVAKQAADPDSTLVIYMGLATLPALSTKLMDSGLPTDTPSAAIERGTTAHQRLVFAKLEDLAEEVAAAHLLSPTLIIIGRVVALSCFWPHKASVKSNQGVQLSVKK